MTLVAVMLRPVSSAASRSAHSKWDSPNSRWPPGKPYCPAARDSVSDVADRVHAKSIFSIPRLRGVGLTHQPRDSPFSCRGSCDHRRGRSQLLHRLSPAGLHLGSKQSSSVDVEERRSRYVLHEGALIRPGAGTFGINLPASLLPSLAVAYTAAGRSTVALLVRYLTF